MVTAHLNEMVREDSYTTCISMQDESLLYTSRYLSSVTCVALVVTLLT